MNLIISNIFSANVLFKVPFVNNTQKFYVTQNQTHQYFHVQNQNDEIVDKTIVINQDAYYVRTEADTLNCLRTDPSLTDFIPTDLDKFVYIGLATLNGKEVAHFRKIEVIDNQQDNYTFSSASEEQQEMYCVIKAGKCIPVQWVMHSISNFHSHKDFYIIDYLTFETTLDSAKFTVPKICINAVETHTKFSLFGKQNRNPKEIHSKPEGKECRLTGTFADSIDWRVKGVATPVKDQVACGSCWTFATAGAIEGRINALRNASNPIRISEQAIVDCFWDKTPTDAFLWSQGCEGGQPDNALKWFIDRNLPLESNYPYFGQNDKCKSEKFSYIDYKVTEVCQVPNEINQLKLALMQGPVAVTIDVTEAMSQYTSGIFNDQTCRTEFQDLVHNVLCVGYGSDAEFGEYWIIKNSWSTNWGMDGYIYISMKNNICGVLTDASYPVVSKA